MTLRNRAELVQICGVTNYETGMLTAAQHVAACQERVARQAEVVQELARADPHGLGATARVLLETYRSQLKHAKRAMDREAQR